MTIPQILSKPTSRPEWKSLTPGSIEEPNVIKKEAGFTIEKPPFEFFNWFWVLVSDWVDYVDSTSPFLRTKEDITISVTSQSEWESVMLFFNMLCYNEYDITINCTYTTVNTDSLIIKDIAGSGSITIVFTDEVELTGIEIVNVLNSVVVEAGTPGLYKYINIEGGKIETAWVKDVFIRRAQLSFEDNNWDSASRLAVIGKNSNVVLYGVGFDGGGTNISPATYLLENEGNLELKYCSFIADPTNVGNLHLSRSYVYTHKEASTKHTDTTMEMAEQVYRVDDWASHRKYSNTLHAYNNADANIIEQYLNQLEVIDADLEIQFNVGGSPVRGQDDIDMSGIGGSGKLTLFNLLATHERRFIVDGMTPKLSVRGLFVDGANTSVPFQISGARDFYGEDFVTKVYTGNTGRCILIKETKGYVDQVLVDGDSEIAGTYLVMRIQDNSVINIRNINTAGFDNAGDPWQLLSLDTFSKVMVRVTTTAGTDLINVEIETAPCSLIAKDEATSDYTHYMEGVVQII